MEHVRYENMNIKQEYTPSYGKITIEPLEKGYGVTLGNSLRRVLLSSIRGAAITAVRIEGVLHEFSTIPGVKEDVIELLVNLKHVAVRSHSNGVTTLRLEAQGPKVVTASDIDADSEIDFPDPSAYICTIEEGFEIKMDIYVETGVGYARIDRPRESYLPLDALLTDALFSPVERVKYEVNDKRQGQNMDQDSLTLEVWTNGVVEPKSAVSQACKILRNYYATIYNTLGGGDADEFVDDPTNDEVASTSGQFSSYQGENPLFRKSIRDLELSVRSENCLLRGGVHLIGDLLNKTRDDLLKTRNLGRISLKEIENKLAQFNLHLSGDITTPLEDDDELSMEHKEEE